MEKKKTQKNTKRKASIVRRIPISEDFYINKYGGGNFRSGLSQLIGLHKTIMKDPKQILFNDIEQLSEHARTLMADNHYEHFVECGIPALLVSWVKTGRVNPKYLKAPNKDLDSFSKENDK